MFNHYCRHSVTNFSQYNSINRNRKKVKYIKRTRKFDLNLGCVFFIYWALYSSYFLLIFLIQAKIFVKILFISCWNYTHLVDKLALDIYLLITVYFRFPNLDKMIFVLISVLIVLILFLFSSKSLCCFKIVLIKKRMHYFLFVIFHQYLFLSCSILWPVFTRLFRITIEYIESKD